MMCEVRIHKWNDPKIVAIEMIIIIYSECALRKKNADIIQFDGNTEIK